MYHLLENEDGDLLQVLVDADDTILGSTNWISEGLGFNIILNSDEANLFD